MILATPRLAADGGLARRSRGLRPQRLPGSSRKTHWAPAYGAALESTGVTFIHGGSITARSKTGTDRGLHVPRSGHRDLFHLIGNAHVVGAARLRHGLPAP